MSELAEIVDQESDGLRFHLSYDYLTAEELSTWLLASHSIYESLFWEPVPAMVGTSHDRRRALQAREVRTGNSIYIDLVNSLGQAVSGMDPTLAGVGGGVAVTALTARVMIHAFSSGHRALTAARRRNVEIAERRLAVDTKRARAGIEAGRSVVDLRSFAIDAEFREFVQVVLRSTTAADFARILEQDQSLTDVVGNALLDAWAVMEHENIRQVTINGETVKGSPASAPDDEHGKNE